MTTMTRQDEHRPAAIDPEDYEYVAQECVKIEGLGDCSFILAERAIIKEHPPPAGGFTSPT